MNEYLDNLYGTSARAADEQEKLAQAEVIDQVLAEQGLTADDLSNNDLLKVAMELFEPESEIVKVAAVAANEEDEFEKIAEADAMGRAMAHADFEKMAGKRLDAVKGGLSSAKKYLGSPINAYKSARTSGGSSGAFGSAMAAATGQGDPLGRLKSLGKAISANKGASATLGGLGLATAGGLGYGAKKAFGGRGGKEKQSSALDAMVEARAIELLESL